MRKLFEHTPRRIWAALCRRNERSGRSRPVWLRLRIGTLSVAIGTAHIPSIAAQSSQAQPSPWPFATGSQSSATEVSRSASPAANAPSATPPARGIPLEQKVFEQVSDRTISSIGQKALEVKPEQWRHGETPHFVVHYRRLADANNVAREIEFDLWYVAQALGATEQQYARRSHVYIFKDEAEWKSFLLKTQAPPWAHSFAHGDELFLDVHEQTGAFDSHNVAHETTHAVVARIYHGRSWPLWLSEGFAEYMGDASVAARHSQTLRRNQQPLHAAEMTVAELTATTEYPPDMAQVERLYDTSAKFVRYLFNRYPKERFPQFAERLLSREPVASALIEVYGPEFRDMAAFEKKFARFVR